MKTSKYAPANNLERTLWTVEWDVDYPEHNITSGWCVVESLTDAFKVTMKLGEEMKELSKEDFAKMEGMPVEEVEGMLAHWSNESGTVRIIEYPKSKTSPTMWKMYEGWLVAFKRGQAQVGSTVHELGCTCGFCKAGFTN